MYVLSITRAHYALNDIIVLLSNKKKSNTNGLKGFLTVYFIPL
jgi:hypothetical protein